MEKRIIIPGTSLQMCPIGLGTLSAGLKWDGKEADAIFGTYLELGGNVIDTARVYQDWVPGEIGRSERVVGDWLHRSGKREQIILMTKGGHPKNTEPTDDIHISRMSDADMRKDLELSLRALQTDWIDVYFYHRDDISQSIEDEIETMESFVKEGKIRYYACSNWTAERMLEADRYCREHGYRGFVADQAFLNIGMHHMNPLSDDTLTYLRGNIANYHRNSPNNLAIAYYCSADGYFHRYLRHGSDDNATYDTPGNRMVANKLKELADSRNTGITQALLGYALCQDYPCMALYGPSSPERIADAMKTLEIPFTKEDYKEVLA